MRENDGQLIWNNFETIYFFSLFFTLKFQISNSFSIYIMCKKEQKKTLKEQVMLAAIQNRL